MMAKRRGMLKAVVMRFGVGPFPSPWLRAAFGVGLPVLAAAAVGLGGGEAQAKGGGGFDQGGYIMGTPGSVSIPVDTDDFFDLDPTFGWGFGGGYMFAEGKLFKATIGGVFEHSLVIFDDLDYDDLGGHLVRFMPEARIGAGTNKVWGYGLMGGGVAVVNVNWRNDFFDLDGRESAPGFNMQLGGGVQAIVYKNLFIGGEFDVDLGFFFEDDDDQFGSPRDDDFTIHTVSIEAIIGWYF
ncbi:hypothetical protein [Plesiocystis pacifica]|uniref:hypothetical protein n=1 Tax=Plesiocystis pacifica TaxID=191768 RepID=UPI0012F994AE|nr:hypothetical protein [Plesiocystis pacifica]